LKILHRLACVSTLHIQESLQFTLLLCSARLGWISNAHGTGLSLPLDEFEVSLNHNEPALLRTRWDLAEANQWLIMNIDVGAEYAGALAVSAGEYNLTYFHLDATSLIFD
jgi:hypothetical protein